MKALFIILNDGSKIQAIAESLTRHGIHGGTVMDGQGLHEDFDFLGDDTTSSTSLLRMLSHGKPLKKILICVMQDDKVPAACDAVNEVVGDLNKERTGVLFTVPVEDTEGFTYF